MGLKIFDCGRLKHDHVPLSISSRSATVFALNLERRNLGHKPLVDPGARDDLDQRDAMITPPAVDSEIHRGGQRNLRAFPPRYARTSSARPLGAEHAIPEFFTPQ